MSVVDVHITSSNGQFKPSKDPVTLSKGKGETIKWYNDTNADLTITFAKGSPFPGNRHPYHIKAGNNIDSGPVQVKESTSWDYAITDGAGAMTDPQVIIQQ